MLPTLHPKKKHPSRINTAYVPLQVIFVPVDSDAYRHYPFLGKESQVIGSEKPIASEIVSGFLLNSSLTRPYLMFQKGTQDTCRISWMIPLQALYHLDLWLGLHQSSAARSFWLSHIHPILALI
jgi:hypothetical protein